MHLAFYLLACAGLFSVPAEAAIVVTQHHTTDIVLDANAGTVVVETNTIVRRLTSDPAPAWACNDPLGKASVDLGSPVLKNGYLFYEEVNVPVKTDNVPRIFQCTIKNSSNQVIETYEIAID